MKLVTGGHQPAKPVQNSCENTTIYVIILIYIRHNTMSSRNINKNWMRNYILHAIKGIVIGCCDRRSPGGSTSPRACPEVRYSASNDINLFCIKDREIYGISKFICEFPTFAKKSLARWKQLELINGVLPL